MQSLAFWVFIAAGAYMIIFEAGFRIRRNTKRGKRSEEKLGVMTLRIANLVLGLLFIGGAFLWFFNK